MDTCSETNMGTPASARSFSELEGHCSYETERIEEPRGTYDKESKPNGPDRLPICTDQNQRPELQTYKKDINCSDILVCVCSQKSGFSPRGLTGQASLLRLEQSRPLTLFYHLMISSFHWVGWGTIRHKTDVGGGAFLQTTSASALYNEHQAQVLAKLKMATCPDFGSYTRTTAITMFTCL